YKEAESHPDILTKQVTYTKQTGIYDQHFKPQQTIEVGKTYTVEELLRYMIVYSDNNARDLLVANMDPIQINEGFKNLGVEIPEEAIGARMYATFYRILFNASYLSKDNSNKVLELLSKTQFNLGIRSGVPYRVEVAHKFGEKDAQDKQQLHDCGIVYYPSHPYLLCLMTQGKDFEKLEHTLRDLSGLVFNEVNAQFHLVDN
ncbi:MAG: class A beta-lactamase-related serine hydrolase, partial [Candidatus Yanofskybacteria bacterium]|nr:class A beta-lactamase-related serine hydrolase [Candidatus Yanofskybacteria bacterium]